MLGDPAGPVLDLVACGALRGRQVVAHTSGRYGLDVLGPVARAGAITLAVHPAQTFGGTADDLPRLPGVAYGVTALGRHWPVAEWLVASCRALRSPFPRSCVRSGTPGWRTAPTIW